MSTHLTPNWKFVIALVIITVSLIYCSKSIRIPSHIDQTGHKTNISDKSLNHRKDHPTPDRFSAIASNKAQAATKELILDENELLLEKEEMAASARRLEKTTYSINHTNKALESTPNLLSAPPFPSPPPIAQSSSEELAQGIASANTYGPTSVPIWNDPEDDNNNRNNILDNKEQNCTDKLTVGNVNTGFNGLVKLILFAMIFVFGIGAFILWVELKSVWEKKFTPDIHDKRKIKSDPVATFLQ